MTYNRFRKQGLPPIDAKLRAKEAIGKLEELRQRKTEQSITSEQAFREMQHVRKVKAAQEIFKKEVPAKRLWPGEASELLLFNSKLEGDYPLEEFVKDYARARQGHPTPHKIPSRRIFYECLLKIMQTRFGKVGREQKERILDTARYSIPFQKRIDRTTLLDEEIFTRLLEENALHRSESQRAILEHALDAELDNRDFHAKIRKATKELDEPDENVINELKGKIKGFSEKEPHIKERIIAEERASKLGDIIAEQILERQRAFLGGLKALFGENARGFAPKADAPSQEEYISQCLALPGNRRFLAQKAIEWLKKAKR